MEENINAQTIRKVTVEVYAQGWGSIQGGSDLIHRQTEWFEIPMLMSEATLFVTGPPLSMTSDDGCSIAGASVTTIPDDEACSKAVVTAARTR